MKNLNKILFGAGITALSFLPMKSFGQKNYIKYLESSKYMAKMVETIDLNNDRKPDVYTEWRDFQDSIEIISIYYYDYPSGYETEKILKTTFNLKPKRSRNSKIKQISSEEAFMGDTLYAKNISSFRNIPIGRFAINCKENYFKKKIRKIQ